MTDENISRHINESADKLVLTTKVKRGSGTRDQDEIKVKVKGDDPKKAVTKLNETVIRLRGTAETLRSTQPGGEDDE